MIYNIHVYQHKIINVDPQIKDISIATIIYDVLEF